MSSHKAGGSYKQQAGAYKHGDGLHGEEYLHSVLQAKIREIPKKGSTPLHWTPVTLLGNVFQLHFWTCEPLMPPNLLACDTNYFAASTLGIAPTDAKSTIKQL